MPHHYVSPYMILPTTEGRERLVYVATICDHTITEQHNAELRALLDAHPVVAFDLSKTLVMTSNWLELLSLLADEVRPRSILLSLRGAHESIKDNANLMGLDRTLFDEFASAAKCLHPLCNGEVDQVMGWLCGGHHTMALGYFERASGSHINEQADVEQWLKEGCPYSTPLCWRNNTVSDYCCSLPNGHEGVCDDGRGNIPWTTIL